MKRINSFIVFLFLSTTMMAQTPDTLFDQGNKAYNLGAYQEAITSYELVLEAEVHSSELYFNLANAYYRLGEVGESVFYFEKAKLLDPENEEILTNLQFAQNMSLDAIEVLPKSFFDQVIETITSSFSIANWAIILIGIAWLLSFLFLLYLFNSNTVWKRLYFSVFWLVTVVFLALFTLTYSKDKQLEVERSGIIFEAKINIWGEPNKRSEVLFELHEGTKVSVTDSLESWIKIKIANGSEGWVTASSLRMLN